MEGSPQTFRPYSSEDTSSALYFHGRTMDEAPLLFSEHPDTSVIKQTKASDYVANGKFFTETATGHPVPETKKNNPDDFLLFTALVIPLLITLWVAKVAFPRIQGAFRAAVNNRFASIFMRNFTIGNHPSTYVIIFNTILCLTVGTWLWLYNQDMIPAEAGLESMMLLLTGFSGYYVFRYLTIYFASVVFKTREITEQYLYRDYFIMTILATVLPLMLFIVAFSPAAYIFWHILIGFIALMQAYRILLSLYTGILETTYGLFYFILYFCTVEIVPVAIALKLIAERISQ